MAPKKEKSTQPIRICTDLFARFFKTSFKKSSFKILQFYANSSNFVAPARFGRAKPLAWLKTIKQTKKQGKAKACIWNFLNLLQERSSIGLQVSVWVGFIPRVTLALFIGINFLTSDWLVNSKKFHRTCFLCAAFLLRQKKCGRKNLISQEMLL